MLESIVLVKVGMACTEAFELYDWFTEVQSKFRLFT